MQAFDYDAVVHDGQVFCTTCLPDGVDEEDCEPIFASSEWDSPPTCVECGEIHDYVCLLK